MEWWRMFGGLLWLLYLKYAWGESTRSWELGAIDRTFGSLRGLSSGHSSHSSHESHDEILLAAGNFTVDKKSVNIAKFQHGKWSIIDAMDLHTFSSEDGVIRDMAALNGGDRMNSHPFELFVVGDFDTATKSSQLAYCSVGVWDGDYGLNKVGEGLCPRGSNSVTAVQMFATAIAGNEKNRTVFVGGNFASRVWNGRHFLDVFNIAMYDMHTNSWRPLAGFQLQDDTMATTDAVVTALSWDATNSLLYVGGDFHIDSYIPYPEGRVDRATSRGVAVWNQEYGLMPFHGGSIERREPVSPEDVDPMDAEFEFTREKYLISHLFYDERSQSLIVTGQFDTVGGMPCKMATLWSFRKNAWVCLLRKDQDLFTKISAAYKDPDGNALYLAGKVNPRSAHAASLGEGKRWSVVELDISAYADPDHDHDHDHDHGSGSDSGRETAGGRGAPGRGQHLESGRGVGVDLLSGFAGTDGPIEVLMLGKGELSGTLLVAGKFVTDSSVLFLPTQREHGGDGGGGGGGGDDDRSRGSTGDKGTAANGRHDDDSSPGTLHHPPGHSEDSIQETMRVAVGLGRRRTRSSGGDGDGDDDTHSSSHSSWETDAVGGNQTLNGTVMALAQLWIPSRKAGSGHASWSKGAAEDDEDVIVFNRNNVSIFVVVGLLVGGGMGVLCAYYYFKSSFSYDMLGDEEPSDDDHAFSMSLRTLSGGDSSSKEQFQKIFRQAMQARHLPTHESLLLINPTEIILSRIIGEGSFGRVWSGTYHNNRVAVKEFVFAQAAVAGESLQRNRIIEEIVGEAGIMGCLRHPKILQIYGCSLTMQAIWITSELCAMGSLRMLLNNDKVTTRITFLQELSLCLDIADGCHYLHTRSPPIIHRDLKSHNIFIQESSYGTYVAKIGDWGSARAVALADSKSKNMTRGIGTACWLAPEVINSGHSSVGSDVYAYGIILWEVMTRKEVYAGLTAEQIIAKVANSDLRPHLPPNLPLSDIMASCWRHEAKERPSFQYILAGLSRAYSMVKSNPSARCKRVMSKTNLLAQEAGGDGGSTLVTDETPVRVPIKNLSGNYGSLSGESSGSSSSSNSSKSNSGADNDHSKLLGVSPRAATVKTFFAPGGIGGAVGEESGGVAATRGSGRAPTTQQPPHGTTSAAAAAAHDGAGGGATTSATAMTSIDGVVGDVELPLSSERFPLSGVGYEERGVGVSVAQLEDVATTRSTPTKNKNYTM